MSSRLEAATATSPDNFWPLMTVRLTPKGPLMVPCFRIAEDGFCSRTRHPAGHPPAAAGLSSPERPHLTPPPDQPRALRPRAGDHARSAAWRPPPHTCPAAPPAAS